MNTPINDDFPAGPEPDRGSSEGELGAGVLEAHLDRIGRLSSDELLTLIADAARLVRRAEAVLVAGSREVAKRSDKAFGSKGLAARHGYARPSFLLEQVTGVSSRTANRYLRVGALTAARVSDTGGALPALYPAVRDALSAGLLGVEAAEVITKALEEAAPRASVDDLGTAEVALVGQATGETVPGGIAVPTDLIAGQARLWKDCLDPNGIEPRAESAFGRRDFWVSRKVENDLVAFGGQLTVDVAAKLHALLGAVLTPRSAPQCLPGGDESGESTPANEWTTAGGSAPKLQETRTPGQQRADVFAAMIDSLARSGDMPTSGGAAPTVLVTVSADTLAKKQGTGQTVGVPDPIPYSAIEQILCDAIIQPVGLDPGGGVAALGTRQRTFNRVQREAIIARDGPTCFECGIPAIGCEVHHVVPWSEGGTTTVDNGVILCWSDHRKMHAGEWTMIMVDGKPVSIPPAWMTRKPYFH
ncbi:hypothetical protein IWX78_001944 [Mycetocola sp. CAN_C7]|uniref:HNH endonuclease n=1 Tax=Mycetocola sp. CAN_C7 TaxID=2787724 RepID=UPI0018C94634